MKTLKKHGVFTAIAALTVTTALSLTAFALTSKTAAAETREYAFENNSCAASVTLTGGTAFASCDSIGVYTKVVSGTAEIRLPLANASGAGFGVRFTDNMTSVAACEFKIGLNCDGTVYYPADDETYALISGGNAVTATVVGGKVSAAKTTYEGADGYFLFNYSSFAIPAEKTPSEIVISAELDRAKRFCIGEVVSANGLTADSIGIKIYTPSENNFTVSGDTENFSASFMRKGEVRYYTSANGDGTDPMWLKFPSQVIKTSETDVVAAQVKEYADLDGFKSMVLDVDASGSEVPVRLGFAFFSGDGANLYNAQRFQPRNYICVSDDGGVTYISAHSGTAFINDGRPTLPVKFKGRVYVSLDDLVARNAANVFNYQKVFPYIKVYGAPTNNAGATMNVSGFMITDAATNVVSHSVTTSGSGTRGTITADKENVLSGSDVKISVTANKGYVIKSVTVNGTACELSAEGEYTVANVTADVSCVAEFIPDPNAEQRVITIEDNEHGTITADKNPAPNGADVEFTVTADLGYEVESFIVNGVAVELKDGKYILSEIENDVSVSMTVTAIEEYVAAIEGSGNVSLDGTQKFGSVYADFDSLFVSGKFKQPIKDGQAPIVGIEIKNLKATDFSTSDALVIQYRALSTSVSSYLECGVKVALADAAGVAKSSNSGKQFYVTDKLDGTLKSGAQISGGMIFTGTPDFSGYIVLPINTVFSKSFECSAEGEFDATKVSSVIIYNDYRWWSDFLAKYFVGNVYLADIEADALGNTNEIWNVAAAAENTDYSLFYKDAEDKAPDGAAADDYASIRRVKGGTVTFMDFSESGYDNEYSDLRLALPEKMLNKEGFGTISNITAIRLKVTNSNDFDIPYSIKFRPWNSTLSEDEWSMTGIGGVIFVNGDEVSYCTKKTTLIPAGFDGYILIPLNNIVFACNGGTSNELPEDIQNYVVLGLPVCGDVITDGVSLSLTEMLFLTENSKIQYTAQPSECAILYELDGGTNGNNPSTYNIESEITLENAVKDGYGFEGWYLNAEFSGNKITEITKGMHGEITLYAKFTAYLDITYDIGNGGTVTPNVKYVQTGAKMTFIVTPDDGYEIQFVSVNDSAVALSYGMFTIENITENLTIKVLFKATETSVTSVSTQTNDCNSAVNGNSMVALLVVAAFLILTARKKIGGR